MDDVASSSSSPVDRKRRRNKLSEDLTNVRRPLEKRSRPTLFQSPNGDDRLWHPRDSVIDSSSQQRYPAGQAKYDSDDQSSLMSEPGSPQALSQVSEEDVSMVSDDEADDAQFSPSSRSIVPENGWRAQLQQTDRAATPVSPSLSQRLLGGHVRSRHPQENSSDKVDVPSPIDEDEVPTPPSAAEAAGTRLQLLTVSDVEMADSVPTIEVHEERSLQLDGSDEQSDKMDSSADGTFLRKGRARSGALSGGDSPMRELPGPDGFPGGNKKHFSMGYRADCAKCRERVPGHMNHFY